MDAAAHESLADFDRNHIWHPYTAMPASQPPIPVLQSHGLYLSLADGRQIIDAMSSWWTTAHGHNHPHLQAAIRAQLEQASHVMFGGLTHPPAVELARKLSALTPEGLDKVFYADSGSVAVEVALKMAYQYQMGVGQSQRNRVLSFYGGYHGDTFATMSLCDPQGGMHSLWQDRVMENVFAPRPPAHDAGVEATQAYLAEVEQRIDHTIAAIIIEPLVQGAGGMHFYDASILHGLRRLCDEHNILLIFDEIATGFGRTGELFAAQTANVTPDIMCLGKALTGGMMSFASTITTQAVAQAASQPAAGGALLHGPTYMGNPLACAVAIASVELFETNYWRPQIPMIQQHLEAGLLPLHHNPRVADVRVLGAIGVVEMQQPVDMLQATNLALEHQVWLRPFGKLVYTMPPLIAEGAEIDTITAAIRAVATHA
ncbi:MAG: adenosylmethionine--8-amino-7-oxononanoate transaminase [Corynebacterium sp.]|nr:adenosylmethionine--8-amino-7-oxononanoate transaminase [Corynebacterium sp.]